jgi:hypothetical protein
MRRAGVILLLLAAFLLAVPAAAGPPVHQATPWWHYDLKFWAPFDDPRSPLRLLRGTGAFTFTRAHDATHTATYVHPGTGLVTVASANQLRIETQGALIEGARTNIALQSEVFKTTWAPTTITIVDDNAVAPDGNSTADLLEATDANSTLLQTVTGTAVPYTFSVYLKRKDGTGDVDVRADSTTWATCAINASTWTRCAVTATLTVAAYTPGVRIVTSGDNVYAWGGQMEAGAFPSSHIPTVTGAVTRNDDILTFSTAGNLSSTLGSISLVVTPNGFPPLDEITLVGNPADFNSFCIHDGSKRLRYREGANGQYFEGVTMANGTTYRAAIAYTDDVGAALALDGAVQSGKTFNGDFAFEASVQVGGSTHAYLFGHIKDLRIWNRAFTDAEMQNITR